MEKLLQKIPPRQSAFLERGEGLGAGKSSFLGKRSFPYSREKPHRSGAGKGVSGQQKAGRFPAPRLRPYQKPALSMHENVRQRYTRHLYRYISPTETAQTKNSLGRFQSRLPKYIDSVVISPGETFPPCPTPLIYHTSEGFATDETVPISKNFRGS